MGVRESPAFFIYLVVIRGSFLRNNLLKCGKTYRKFSGRLPEDFDADKELQEAREEKYGNIS